MTRSFLHMIKSYIYTSIYIYCIIIYIYMCTYSLCSDLAGSWKYTKPCKKKNYLMLVKPLRSRDHQNHGREGKRQQVVLEGLSSTADGWLPSSRLEHRFWKKNRNAKQIRNGGSFTYYIHWSLKSKRLHLKSPISIGCIFLPPFWQQVYIRKIGINMTILCVQFFV